MAANDHPPLCDVHTPTFVTLSYIPAGRSEPQERTFAVDWERDVDAVADLVVARAWDAGDEPLSVRSFEGRLLWSNSRFGEDS